MTTTGTNQISYYTNVMQPGDSNLNRASGINSEVAALPGFEQRLDDVCALNDSKKALHESLAIVKIGTDIQADIAQVLAGINVKRMIETTMKKSFWSRTIFWFKRDAEEILEVDSRIEEVESELTILYEFIVKTIAWVQPRFDALRIDMLITQVLFPEDNARNATMQSAVQTTMMMLITMNSCLTQIDQDLMRIKQLQAVTIPAWILAKTQKKLLSITKIEPMMLPDIDAIFAKGKPTNETEVLER
jgi:CRISPR/Cas system CMR-associated protein Cmr5 small subunit